MKEGFSTVTGEPYEWRGEGWTWQEEEGTKA